MKKLKLELDTLAVESFAASDHTAEPVGTVRGLSGDFCGSSACDSFRICPPKDPSYYPCTTWDVPCG